jgi:GTP pyrophosphokinase
VVGLANRDRGALSRLWQHLAALPRRAAAGGARQNRRATDAPDPRLLAAHEALRRARTDHPDIIEAAWSIGEATARTLIAWQLPPAAIVVALLTPHLENGLMSLPALAARFGADAADLASRFGAFRAITPTSTSGGALAPGICSRRLRYLLRQIYLDLPRPDLGLLALADHDARLAVAGSAPLAVETQHIFAPLADMLGLWTCRRAWIERSALLLHPQEYRAFTRLLEEAPHDRSGGDLLDAAGGSAEAVRRDEDRPAASDRLQVSATSAFIRALREAIDRAGLSAFPEIHHLPRAVGEGLQRWRDGESPEDIYPGRRLCIVCSSPQECYSILGVVHSLGVPVGAKSVPRFDDYIAAPKANGYRALRTAITYRRRSRLGGASGDQPTILHCEILTASMHHLNEFGVVAALYQHPHEYADVATWWTALPRHSARLQARYRAFAGSGISAFLSAVDIGAFTVAPPEGPSDNPPSSGPRPIYVFTPGGELVLLDEGSTGLDYAHHIHSTLGNYAARIEVNGETAFHGRPLRNGDLVRVHLDPGSHGPDISWLTAVTTPLARRRIRRALANRARSIHPGRAQIEAELLTYLDFYRTVKQYRFTVTTARLEAFLRRRARLRGLATLDDLYAAVAERRLSPNRLARRLIADELGAAIVTAQGERLPYPLHRIALCDRCRPVPGEDLRMYERRTGTTTRGIMIHVASCASARRDTPHVVRWATAPAGNTRSVELEILARDRYRLLGDLLDVGYAVEGVSMRRVTAEARADGRAAVTLIVEADDAGHLAELETRLGLLRDVGQVFCYPLSPAHTLALAIRDTPRDTNPYTLDEVHDSWMFFDREGLIKEIGRWIDAPPPTHLLVLHGPGRVGKSSLARFVIDRPAAARPYVGVFVNLQGLSTTTIENVASYIAGSVSRELRIDPPSKHPTEEWMPWLSRVLDRAQAEMRGRRLLVVLDEMAVLLNQPPPAQGLATSGESLVALMSSRRDVNWLLIVHDEQRDPRLVTASGLFQRAEALAVPHLDAVWAMKLIVDPFRHVDVAYAAEIPERIADLTAGNPYLIQVICHALFEMVVPRGRRRIGSAELAEALDGVLADGDRYFAHFLRSVRRGRGSAIARAIVTHARADGWLALPELATLLAGTAGGAVEDQDLWRLERSGVIERGRSPAGVAAVRLSIPLFHEWASRYLERIVDHETGGVR